MATLDCAASGQPAPDDDRARWNEAACLYAAHSRHRFLGADRAVCRVGPGVLVAFGHDHRSPEKAKKAIDSIRECIDRGADDLILREQGFGVDPDGRTWAMLIGNETVADPASALDFDGIAFNALWQAMWDPFMTHPTKDPARSGHGGHRALMALMAVAREAEYRLPAGLQASIRRNRTS